MSHKPEWGRRRSDNQPYPKTRGKEELPTGLKQVTPSRKEMEIEYEGSGGVAWAKCGCSGYMDEEDFETLTFVVTDSCPSHKEGRYSTKGQTWEIQGLKEIKSHRGSAVPDVVKMETLQRKRESERRARADFEKIKEYYPELKYEDVAIVTPVAVKMKDSKIYRVRDDEP